MKKSFIFLALIVLAFAASAQSCYWVMLTDKAGTTFDPYSYFDGKAIERYRLNNADLYDISNYPLNSSYVSQIDAIAADDFGQSRWLNAVAVTATPEQIAAIQKLPFVKEVVMLQGKIQTCETENVERKMESEEVDPIVYTLTTQLMRMDGKEFRKIGVNGKGVRVAVFDGGFPQVNTHIAFKHLRDNKQIIKTWNFPNKKENVYGWNSHGLMTLSCIAGIHRYEGTDGEICVDEGLATGAEFLLARTEVEAEPFKEEVWWQMAVEWADKNGAQIISSSLGYGKDRYYTKDMNGQSYVAKAGNMAARKGILVCNSAGNEGDDNSWRTIITPADADSVLCVGGITHSLTEYEHISFSSYGPSADGRQKPNVVAFGHAHTANTGKSNDDYHFVDGTSFSCPLVAGFAACALQAQPQLTAMQLFHEIEKSADLYPYCDYTYGYGVPQAGHFCNKIQNEIAKPTFKFEKDSSGLNLIPLVTSDKDCRIFIKNSKPDGTIINYKKLELSRFTDSTYINISGGHIITAQYNGYVASYELNDTNDYDYMSTYVVGDLESFDWDEDDAVHYSHNLKENNALKGWYFMLGVPVRTSSDELQSSIWSPAKRVGYRSTRYFTKAYGWGFALEYGHTSYRLGDEIGDADQRMGTDALANATFRDFSKHRINLGEFGIELYQRVRFVPGGIFHKGWHWDLGVYGSWGYNVYKMKGALKGTLSDKITVKLHDVDALSAYRWNWGVTTRISRDWLGIYARYCLNGLVNDFAANEILLPRLEAGIQLAF